MVSTFSECLKDYGSAYQIRKAVREGKIYQIEKGVYADVPKVSAIEKYLNLENYVRQIDH